MYASYLAQSGFDAIATPNADDALTKLVKADIVVTGIQIEGSFDGVELIRRVRLHHPTKPVIVLTAWDQPPRREAARQAGCAAFLSKPCLPDVLLCEIQRVLGRSRALREQSDPARQRAPRVRREAEGVLKKAQDVRDRYRRAK
jgi:DNA-binding response OmpR family regulator